MQTCSVDVRTSRLDLLEMLFLLLKKDILQSCQTHDLNLPIAVS